MPRYDFKCEACEQVLERRVQGTPESIRCEGCGAQARRLSPVRSVMIAPIPAHFRLTHREQLEMVLPLKENGKPDYSNSCLQKEAPSRREVDGLGEWLEKDLGLGPERITLNGG
jgi:putative FmdB family regulatory protein